MLQSKYRVYNKQLSPYFSFLFEFGVLVGKNVEFEEELYLYLYYIIF